MERHCSTNNIMSTFMIPNNLSRIFNLKAVPRYKMPMKASMSTLSISLTRLYFVEPSRGSENLSITGCIFLFAYCTMFLIILSVKKSLNDEDGFFTDLAAHRGPGLFLYTFSAPILWICLSYLFSTPFLPFSWSWYIQNYAQLVVVSP